MKKHLALHSHQNPTVDEQLENLSPMPTLRRRDSGRYQYLIARGRSESGLLISPGDFFA
jgi:hypothetical protein